MLESLKLNDKTESASSLQNRIDACTHASALKDGEFASMSGPALRAHLLALREYWPSLPMDILCKLCLHKSSVLLGVIIKAEEDRDDKTTSKKDESLSNAVREWCEYSTLVPPSPGDADEETEANVFDPLNPKFSGIVQLMQKAKRLLDETEDGSTAQGLSWVWGSSQEEDVKDSPETLGEAKALLQTQKVQDW